jgi:catechol 2,3-dioxygenase-like lactoylglutathione lyase family enzyme
MKPHVSAITLGVKDVAKAKQFYHDGLGWPTLQDYGEWVAFGLDGGSSMLGIISRKTLAGEAGVAEDGSGFRGVTLSYTVRDEQTVERVMAEAEKAGAKIVKPAQKAQWGGYFGYFADPDGYLWKVAGGGGDQPFNAE